MDDRLPFESELIARISWLIRLRWIAVLGTGAAVGLVCLLLPGSLASGPLLAVTAAIALYNLLVHFYLVRLRLGTPGTGRLRTATLLAYTQIVLDLLALAVLIHYSGGVENPIAFFFVFHVIIGSILLRLRVSYLVAGLAVALLTLVGTLEYAGVLAHYPLPFVPADLYQDLRYLLFFLAAMAATLFLAAYLTTSISARLRDRDRDLMESNLTCQIRSSELVDLNEQLQRLDEERTRFLVLVTHELRAPISTIYSALDLARSGVASPEKTHEVLGRAQRRATDLLDLINDLLELTRARQQTAKPEDVVLVRLDEMLLDAVRFMRVEAEEKGLGLTAEIAPDLAPVLAMPGQMKLVWTNLLSNALKYTAPGGRVQASLDQDEGWVVGQVRDTGIGITEEALDRVFDEFYRAGNARLVSPHGSGVGLATVRHILENLGGTIAVDSQPGKGSTFTFRLPTTDD